MLLCLGIENGEDEDEEDEEEEERASVQGDCVSWDSVDEEEEGKRDVGEREEEHSAEGEGGRGEEESLAGTVLRGDRPLLKWRAYNMLDTGS